MTRSRSSRRDVMNDANGAARDGGVLLSFLFVVFVFVAVVVVIDTEIPRLIHVFPFRPVGGFPDLPSSRHGSTL